MAEMFQGKKISSKSRSCIFKNCCLRKISEMRLNKIQDEQNALMSSPEDITGSRRYSEHFGKLKES